MANEYIKRQDVIDIIVHSYAYESDRLTDIQELPVYDVDKVIETLKERSIEYNSGVRLHGKPEEMITDEVIEIVKQGDVSDDVCQWSYSAQKGKWTSDRHKVVFDGDIACDWNYCPYCGKKIKEVTEESPDTDITEKYLGNKEWIDVRCKVPDTNRYILLSFSNIPMPAIGRYELDENGGAFYIEDEDESCVTFGAFVNAWMELPERYKG